MTMTKGTLGDLPTDQQVLGADKAKDKKLLFQRVAQKLFSTWSPGSAGPTTCVFAFADISGQLGHQAQRTYPAQPWFLVWA